MGCTVLPEQVIWPDILSEVGQGVPLSWCCVTAHPSGTVIQGCGEQGSSSLCLTPSQFCAEAGIKQAHFTDGRHEAQRREVILAKSPSD